jgi:hypothetical protein
MNEEPNSPEFDTPSAPGAGDALRVAKLEGRLKTLEGRVEPQTACRLLSPRPSRLAPARLFRSSHEARSGTMSRPPAPPQVSEVRPYLIRLVSLIIAGVILMASVAVYAWNTFGARLSEAPPLPPGTPPLSSAPPP